MKNLNIPVDYCCLLIQHVIKSLVSGIEIKKIGHIQNDVFRIEKKGLKSTVSKIIFTEEPKYVCYQIIRVL